MGRRLRIPFKSQSVSRIMLFMFRIGVNQVWLIRACSSAWLERTPDKREVGSSSLPRPTIFGGVAQLGEHLLCMQKVVGSIPIASTTLRLRLRVASHTKALRRRSVRRSLLSAEAFWRRLMAKADKNRCGLGDLPPEKRLKGIQPFGSFFEASIYPAG